MTPHDDTSGRKFGDYYLDSICMCSHRWGVHIPGRNNQCDEHECECETFKERSTAMNNDKQFPQELYEIADMLGLSLYDLAVLCLKEASRTSEYSVAWLADRVRDEAQAAEIAASRR
jgi:hypothetical protein